jgi:pimeloyl-ACP methyl ester carboxylesterase
MRAANTPYVFVSYASADRDRILPVVASLERAGVSVWLDRAGIPGGASYAAAITAAIKGAAALVLLASPVSFASRNVRQELALAWRYEIPYLVLRLDPVDIPDELAYWLEASQWVEVLGQEEGAWLPTALAALRGLGLDVAQVATPSPAPTPPPAPPPPPAVLLRPETRYARSGDLSIAYQVVGDGPVDLVYVPGFISHVEWTWENPLAERFWRRVVSFSRQIHFDKRGTGLSDRVAHVATLEERMDDIRAVLDAAGSTRAVIFGASEGTALAVLFAATYPERAAALIIYGGMASYVRRPDYPWRPPAEDVQRTWIDEPSRTIHQTWGTTAGLDEVLHWAAPSLAGDEGIKRWLATNMRLGASPGAEIARRRMNIEIDIRHVLPTVRVPTLVLHRTGDPDEHIDEGRYLAAHIPGARFVEVPGVDHVMWAGEQDAILDAIEALVAEVVPDTAPESVLATVLALDALAPEGGAVQSELVEELRAMAQHEFARYRGQQHDIDGVTLLATFDGPARAARCAQALVRVAAGRGLAVRAGLHAGECVLGDHRATGPAVDLAIRVAGQASPGEVLASDTVRDLVPGAGLSFAERGEVVFPGLPGSRRLFAVG